MQVILDCIRRHQLAIAGAMRCGLLSDTYCGAGSTATPDLGEILDTHTSELL